MSDTTVLPIAGWYPDPEDASSDRWWNGSGWSDHRRTHVEAPTADSLVEPAPVEPVNEAITPIVEPAAAPTVLPPTASAHPGSGGTAYAASSTSTDWFPAARPFNTLALIGMVISLVGAVVNIFFLGLPGLAGGIVSTIGLSRANRLKSEGALLTGRGFAIAGVVVGYVGFALTLAFLIGLAAWVSWLRSPTFG